MYLLNKFSTLVDTAVSFTDIAGYTHRYGWTLKMEGREGEGGGGRRREGGEPCYR